MVSEALALKQRIQQKDAERSEKAKELFKGTSSDDLIGKTLDIWKAVKIARELRGFPKEKMIEVAVEERLADHALLFIFPVVETFPQRGVV